MSARTTKKSSKPAPAKSASKGSAKPARKSAKPAGKVGAKSAKTTRTTKPSQGAKQSKGAKPSAKRPAKAGALETSKSATTSTNRPAAKGATTANEAPKLLEAMTGKASPAKAADGDKPVFAYIATLPQPQREIAERVDALAARTLPNLHRAVKWGMAYYGVGDGWCFSSGAFVGHVKVMFINGVTLTPVPPVTPIGMGKSTRGVELQSVRDIDEVQLAAWMRQITSVPGIGGKKR